VQAKPDFIVPLSDPPPGWRRWREGRFAGAHGGCWPTCAAWFSHYHGRLSPIRGGAWAARADPGGCLRGHSRSAWTLEEASSRIVSFLRRVRCRMIWRGDSTSLCRTEWR